MVFSPAAKKYTRKTKELEELTGEEAIVQRIVDVADKQKDWLVEKLELGTEFGTPKEWKDYLKNLKADLLEAKFVEIID